MEVAVRVLGSRSWRRRIGAVLLFISPLCAQSRGEESVSDIVGRIKAYEALFDHVRIRYHTPKGTTLDPVFNFVSASSTAEIVIDGPRMRRDLVMPERDSQRLKTLVTDGTRVIEWTRSSDEPEGGTAIIQPHYSGIGDMLGHSDFVRHSNIDAVNLSKITIVEDTPAHVELLFESRPDRRLRTRYSSFGEWLRTESYEPESKDANGTWQTGFQYYFTYRDGVEATLENAGPIRMVRRSIGHGVSNQYEIDSVDFAPAITDKEFSLELPVGVLVDDHALRSRPRPPAAIMTRDP